MVHSKIQLGTMFTAWIAGSLFLGPLQAEDWPHWRGADGNGVARDAHPPTSWSPTKNVRWKLPIPGRGSGSPVVWQDRVFVVSAVPVEGGDANALVPLDFVLFCVDRREGKVLWRQTAIRATPHEGTHETNSFASASPCTDGELVYAHFGSRGLYAYTLEGELVWQRDLGPMATRNTFGEGSSPTLAGDLLLVPWDHEGPSYLYALNKRTGETVWRAERDEPTNWATPLVVTHQGRQQVVMNGQTCARGYDLQTGQELWRCEGQTERPAASPVAGDGLVFVGSGFRGSFLGAFRLEGRGDLAGTSAVAWTIDRDTPDIASLLLSGNRLYFHKAKTGILTCVDAQTGKPFFSAERVPDIRTTYASPVAGGGYVFVTGRSGTTVVLKDAEQFEVVSVNSVGEGVDATPALVDDEIFIRGEQHLFCLAEDNR